MAKYIVLGALVALGIGLVASAVMIISPRRTKVFSDRLRGLVLLAIIVFMIYSVVSTIPYDKFFPATTIKPVPRVNWWRLSGPLALLGLGILTFLKPTLLYTWVRQIHSERSLAEWEVKRVGRGNALIFILAGVISLLITVGVSINADRLLLFFSLFWIACGVYITARPGRFLVQTQYPWTRLPVWGTRVLGAVIFLTGVVMLHIYVLRIFD